MIIKKTKFNKYGWQSIFKYRESGKPDLIIVRKSKLHPEDNHEVYIDNGEMEELLKFLLELKEAREK